MRSSLVMASDRLDVVIDETFTLSACNTNMLLRPVGWATIVGDH